MGKVPLSETLKLPVAAVVRMVEGGTVLGEGGAMGLVRLAAAGVRMAVLNCIVMAVKVVYCCDVVECDCRLRVFLDDAGKIAC